MAFLDEERLRFHFARNTKAFAYDRCSHRPRGRKAVDFVVWRVAAKSGCWFIEVKDFRDPSGEPSRKNVAGLPENVNAKVRQSLEDLADWPAEAEGYEAAQQATSAGVRRVVLHLEFHGDKSKFLPKVPDPAFVRQKLRQLLGDIDPDPLVLDVASTAKEDVPWRVTANLARSPR